MAIELRGVSKRYPNGAIGAADVDLVTRPGEYVALFGPSGSGKTSLLQMIGLLLHPDEGEVLIDGERVDNLPEAATAELRRSRLGFIFQSAGLLPLLSAAENVDVSLRLLGVGGRKARDRVTEALDSVDMVDRAAHRPDPQQLENRRKPETAAEKRSGSRQSASSSPPRESVHQV